MEVKFRLFPVRSWDPDSVEFPRLADRIFQQGEIFRKGGGIGICVDARNFEAKRFYGHSSFE